MVLYNGNLFWADPSYSLIKSIPVGGGAITTLASGVTASDLAVDDVNVYWLDGSNVNKAPIAGGLATVLVSGQVSPSSIATDGQRVYWTNAGSSTASTGTVRSVQVGGGAPKTLASGQGEPSFVKADASQVYWGNVLAQLSSVAVGSVPSLGGSTTPLVAGSSTYDSVRALAQVGSTLYFWVGGTLYSVPSSGGAPTLVGTTSTAWGDPHSVYVDTADGYSYDAAGATYDVHAMALADGVTRVVAHIPGLSPLSLAGDATYLYAANYFGIWRVAR
jgi:hypothetical protein